MTPRERLLAALDGRPTDRVPLWLLFPFHPLNCYVDVRQHPDLLRHYRRNGMTADLSWDRASLEYTKLYETLLSAGPVAPSIA